MSSVIDYITEKEPAMIGTITAGIVSAITVLGPDEKIVGVFGALFTVLVGLWIRARAWSKEAVTAKVTEAATKALEQATSATVGEAGSVTSAGDAIVANVTNEVLAP